MAVTQNLVTTNFNVHSAKQFVESFSEISRNEYFVYAGKHTPYPNSDSSITTPNNSVQATHLDVYDNMIFAKRVSPSDVTHMIIKNLWVSGTVYSEYSHLDGDLSTKSFYAVVDDTSEYNVWKCLFNNFDSPATIAPARVGSTADLNPQKTGDDYIWKYMYTINKTNYKKFATSNYVPVIANTSVISGAIPGTIEVVKVIDGGIGYDNYIASGVFKTGDINIGGVNTVYGAPETAKAEDDYYQGCVLKITSGAGIGQFRRIVNYEGQSVAQKKFLLDSGFTTAPQINDTYEVYPYIFVWGDGNESTPAEGRAIIDSTQANTISNIEMMKVGKDYRYAVAYPSESPSTIPIAINSVYIQLPATITSATKFLAATLQPILSPKGGHGSDPLNELFANRICISSTFSQSEVGTIPVQNDFRQIGLIKDPLYTNVDLILKAANTIGSFSIGETVYQYKQVKLFGNTDISVSGGTATISKTDQGKLSTTISILNPGYGYDISAGSGDNSLVFTGGDGSFASATIVANSSVQIKNGVVQSNNCISGAVPNFIAISPCPYANGERILYNPTTISTSGINGLSNGTFYFVSAANTIGFKLASTWNGSALTITSNTIDTGSITFTTTKQSNAQSNNSVTTNFISVSPAGTSPFANNDRVKYQTVTVGTAGITGLSNNYYYYAVYANSTGMSLSDTIGGAAKTISSVTLDTGNVNFYVVNGSIQSVTVTNQGTGYTTVPSVTVNTLAANGSSGTAQFLASIANPTITLFKDSFDIGDYVLVNKSSNNYLASVTSIPYDYQITASYANTLATFSATNGSVSVLKLFAKGTVTSISTSQLTLSNVSGIFTESGKVIGLTTGATSVIDTSGAISTIQINDKAAAGFNTSVQLTRLIGNFTSGSLPFIEDEYIRQESLIAYAQPHGYLHHSEINNATNDDVLYISNAFGIYNLDPGGVRSIQGNTSDATLDYLSNKYPGDFVKGSGEVIYYENLDAITRSDNKSEIIKIILEF
jgi:hypothetical protein